MGRLITSETGVKVTVQTFYNWRHPFPTPSSGTSLSSRVFCYGPSRSRRQSTHTTHTGCYPPIHRCLTPQNPRLNTRTSLCLLDLGLEGRSLREEDPHADFWPSSNGTDDVRAAWMGKRRTRGGTRTRNGRSAAARDVGDALRRRVRGAYQKGGLKKGPSPRVLIGHVLLLSLRPIGQIFRDWHGYNWQKTLRRRFWVRFGVLLPLSV